MERVLVVFPTLWDLRHLRGRNRPLVGSVELAWAAPSDADCPWDFDVLGFIEHTVRAERGRIAGVFSSSDYPGAAVAAAIATELGLPGPRPEHVLRAAHKHESRLVQRAVAPEATPRFALVDPRRQDGGPPAIGFPAFVKPVKGSFSMLARRVADQRELESFLAQPTIAPFTQRYMRIFDRLVERYARFEHGGGWFLAEEPLGGEMATVEGFVHAGAVELVGIVDSAVDPATNSFVRFDYPSALPPAVQARMADVARRVAGALELSGSMFNVEMFWDRASDRVHVIEVNPRMCGQFADLYAKVDGVHGYEIALALACGRRPALRRGAGPCGAAASVPLRSFEPVRVKRAPSEEEIEELERELPGTLVWTEHGEGEELVDHEALEDGASVRYAVVNTGALDRAALDLRIEEIRRRLPYAFEPLAGARAPARASRGSRARP